jgi:hypothetical protein
LSHPDDEVRVQTVVNEKSTEVRKKFVAALATGVIVIGGGAAAIVTGLSDPAGAVPG